MKKIFVTILVMACFISQMDAQIRFGLKAGLNFDTFKTESVSLTHKNSTGWQAGAMLQVMIPVIGLGVQPELLYTAKKLEIDNHQNGIGYFEVPVNLRYEFNLLLLRPFLTAGPYFGYIINTCSETKDIEKSEWGLGFGGGLEVWKIHLGLRYSLGIKDVKVSDVLDVKNRTFSISLGYLF